MGFDIRNIDNELGKKAYMLDNYYIEYTNKTNKICYIYFSGNGLYEDTEANFKHVIFDTNRYEWQKRKGNRAEKNIFVRDIYKQWYILGINERVNSIDSLVELLKTETNGYETVCVGVSAGGYIATLVGAKLENCYVINFSGQWSLESRISSNPLLSFFEGGNYINICSVVQQGNSDVFYFAPIENEDDKEQIPYAEEAMSGGHVKIFYLKSSSHGIIISKYSVEVLLKMSHKQMMNLYERYKGRIIEPAMFEKELNGSGIKTGIYNQMKTIYRFAKNKF